MGFGWKNFLFFAYNRINSAFFLNLLLFPPPIALKESPVFIEIILIKFFIPKILLRITFKLHNPSSLIWIKITPYLLRILWANINLSFIKVSYDERLKLVLYKRVFFCFVSPK